MSAIHDALKKAQREKDSLEREPSLPPRAGRSGDTGKLAGLWPWAVLLLLLAGAAIGYAAFLRPPPDARNNIPSGPRPEAAAPAPPAAVRAAEDAYEKARGFQKLGLFQEARKWYIHALRVDPGHVRALNNLGVLLMQQGDAAAARERLEKAVLLDPGAVDPVYNLACLHALAGDPAAAIAYLQRAIALDPAAGSWAKEDGDLASLRGTAPFDRLVEKTPPL